MKLYSTLDKGVVEIKPLKKGVISMYNCGPTVYNKMHIGNIRAYVNWDILHRALMYLGYDVKRVMNMTDVGHMTADEDFGEDKLQTQASKEGVNPMDIANKYIKSVLEDYASLNILAPSGDDVDPNWDVTDLEKYGWTRATDYIQQMIDVIKDIESNGFAYETDQAVYFDVTKLEDYTIFTGQKLEDKQTGVREDVNVDKGKKNSADFVLWMKKVGKYANHIMEWESPWGVGFPGWHIECSAMSTAVLGEYFDIHTGGIDHIPIHHPNERAQNIGAFGHSVVKYWIHNEWLVGANGKKLSKSDGTGSNLEGVLENGTFDPMDIRYLFLSINYRTKAQLSKEALEGARNARTNLMQKMYDEIGSVIVKGFAKELVSVEYRDAFEEALSSNLNMSKALSVVNDLLGNASVDMEVKASTILDFDKVLGLDIEKILKERFDIETQEPLEGNVVPEKRIVNSLLADRDKARELGDYSKADEIRYEIESYGFKILDSPKGSKVVKI